MHLNVYTLSHREGGSAPVSFLLTSLLIITVFLGLIQGALIMHSRNVLTDIAGEAARQGARLDATSSDAVAYANSRAGQFKDFSVNTAEKTADGRELIVVQVSASLPVLGLFTVPAKLYASGRAVIESDNY